MEDRGYSEAEIQEAVEEQNSIAPSERPPEYIEAPKPEFNDEFAAPG
jgi:hypothetical protein